MIEIRKLTGNAIPETIRQIHRPPTELYLRGTLPQHYHYLTIVGSRNHSNYGRDVIEKIINGLSGYPICIVSGLALGIDTLAHEYALDAKLPTVAIPGSGLAPSVLYPAHNRGLADRILTAGGALLSPFVPEFRATNWSFPQRNRLLAAISDTILVIEAEKDSGALITAHLALEFNKTICAVPGSIFSPASAGTNLLIKQGATPITHANELLDLYHITPQVRSNNDSLLLQTAFPEELKLLELLYTPLSRGQLHEHSAIDMTELSILLSQMEIKGFIREEFGLIRRLV